MTSRGTQLEGTIIYPLYLEKEDEYYYWQEFPEPVIVQIGNFQWSLKVKVMTDDRFIDEFDVYVDGPDEMEIGDFFRVTIDCLPVEDEQTNSWKVDTEIELELTKLNGEKIRTSDVELFKNDTTTLTFWDLLLIDDFVDPDVEEEQEILIKVHLRLEEL